MVPHVNEFEEARDDRMDPLGEEDHEVVPHLVHRYPDRVLLLITDRCASYCRFCTRKRWVGQGPTPKPEHLQQALDYVREHQTIREVIVSGGDALMLDDAKLDKLLGDIRQIKHVDIIRLGTRMLAFAPMRVTKNLVEVLKKHQPVYVMSHFNHSNELSPQASQAIKDLVDAGVPVLNQTVLLKGVNDNAESLSELFRALTRLRARPYDLHQCDVVKGASQFRVPLERALQIMKQLRGHISGLCVPHFIVDIPGGFGKVSITPESIVKRDDTHVYLQGFDGEVAPYPLD
ncbi:MAG: KamA family radical SAM protein [Methylococcaceae bacterium]|nr:KamA family radical SAM protein [Methylococcaceae bacterium]